MSGGGFKANRDLEHGIQNQEELDNVDLAQIELNQDAYERELRRIEISKEIKEGKLDPKVYRGQAGYASYFDKTEDDLKKKQFNGTLGPTKVENYVKESARIDYNPELCKDYFETGHCAFGDTCIFIHDRTDYASGHQLEKDWNDKQRKLHKKLMGKKYGEVEDSDSDNDSVTTKVEEVDEEGLPLKCKIWNDYFKEPVITQCGHYFCEKCALSHYRKDKTCFICKKATYGSFNEGSKLTTKLSKMSWQQIANYRFKYSIDGFNELHKEEHKHGDKDCSHSHSKLKQKQKVELTEEELQEERMKEFIDKQKKIKENNMKPTACDWVIP